MDATEPDSSDSDLLEKPKPTPKPPKVDRRRTGGLANRSPAQVAAYEKMREVAAQRVETARLEKIARGANALAVLERRKERKNAIDAIDAIDAKATAPERRSRTKIVLQSSDSESDSGPTIVIRKSKRTRNSKRMIPESESSESETDATPELEPVRQKLSFTYV